MLESKNRTKYVLMLQKQEEKSLHVKDEIKDMRMAFVYRECSMIRKN